MKKKLSKFSSKLQFCVLICVTLVVQSCVPDRCDPPGDTYGDLIVTYPLDVASGPCQTENSGGLINALNTNGMNGIAKNKSDDPNKWVIQVIVGGVCPSGKGAWTKTYLKGDFIVKAIPGYSGNANGLSFTLKNVPKSENGTKPVTASVRLLGPCRQGNCQFTGGKNIMDSYRVAWSNNASSLEDPAAGKTYKTIQLIQDLASEECQ